MQTFALLFSPSFEQQSHILRAITSDRDLNVAST